MIYTDEDKVTTDLTEHFQPHLKPDFNLDLLRSNNYICHFFVVQKKYCRKGPEVSGKNSTELRITILSSAVRRMPERFYMFRKSCITGEHTKPPLQIILPVK